MKHPWIAMRARSNTVASKAPAGKKAKETGAAVDSDSQDATVDLGADTVKVYAWNFEDVPFEDQQSFAATLPADLETLKVWKPEDEDDDKGLPKLMSINFVHHEGLEDDTDGKSRGIATLFADYIKNDGDFFLYFDGEPDFSLMELTLAKKKPETGPFVNVHIGPATLDEMDGFYPDSSKAHDLQGRGYSWVIAVRIDRDQDRLRMTQKLVKAHIFGVSTLLESDNANDEAGAVAKTTVGNSETAKLYFWVGSYPDDDEEDLVFAAVTTRELQSFGDWKPKDERDDSGLPPLLGAVLPDHKSLKHDVDGKSAGVSKLFDAYLKNDADFFLIYGKDPEHKLFEVTIASEKPSSGPYVEIKLVAASLDQMDGFELWREKLHELYEKGYKWIVGTRVEQDPKILRLSQRFVQGHNEGIFAIIDELEESSEQTVPA
ncbi:hypothetical protein EWM64_g9757 [Hericium alpestre]|uniref:Uncharacterized protein n=1 Tax=Hericium alpestre TaxID=135208 RepID=A0A4Y9ZHN8_9AGAM|nr:hypothetical protein EWM64_g9757 [Hericium alpestre]